MFLVVYSENEKSKCYDVTMLLCYVGLSVMFSMFNLHLPMKIN